MVTGLEICGGPLVDWQRGTMSEINLEAAKRLLQQQDDNGYSAYEHISEILLKLVSEQPENALELFEHLSIDIKAKRPAPPASDGSAADAARATAADWSANCIKLVTGEKDPETEEFIPPPEDAEDRLEDIIHVTEDLEWAGVSFGEEESIRIKQAMVTTLGQNEGIEKLRFWGKVLGTNADYYVLEATQDGVLNEDEEADEGVEEIANKFAYYVSTEVGKDFVRLPNVSAAHVLGASSFRKFLTGDLAAPVKAHPPFPGSEAHLLRATIARINGETSVAPSYFYQAAEAEEDEVVQEVTEGEQLEDEEFVPPTVSQLAAGGVSMFRTFVPPHNPNGFVGVPTVPDPEDPESSIPDPAAPKAQPAVRELDASEWTVQVANNNVALRSVVWPGLTTLANSRRAIRVYVGYGVRADPPAALQWSPQFPASIPEEVNDEDIVEQPDEIEKPAEPEPEPEDGEEGEDDE